MKFIKLRSVVMLVLLMFVMVTLSACGPARKDEYVEVASNETAFVVPLEGDTNAQKQMLSIDYLNKSKVATKRIYLPLKKVKTGRWWFNYKWVPTVHVITVDRKPVRLLWSEQTGIKVESRDSIGFTVGIDITGHVSEENTAKFLYFYPSGDLASILSDAVKSKSTEILSREFARYNLEGKAAVFEKDGTLKTAATEGAREKKGDIVDLAKKELIDYFDKQGVTIDTFGLIGGLWYEDDAIQNAINKNFSSALEIENKRNERLGQDETNRKELSITENERKKAQEFALAEESRTKQVDLEIRRMAAEAKLEWAKKWNGVLPANIMPEASNVIMDMK